MSVLNQKTINKTITFEGVGLHTGNKVNMKIFPAEPNTGITFKRTDLKKNNLIIPNIFNVINTNLCTTVANEFGAKISTIEHLMAAFFGKGIDNALVEIDNEEVPIMDGSSEDLINVLKKINLVDQFKKRKYLKVTNKVEFIDGKRKISIEPNQSSLEVHFQLNYKNKIIGKQENVVDFQKDLQTCAY